MQFGSGRGSIPRNHLAQVYKQGVVVETAASFFDRLNADTHILEGIGNAHAYYSHLSACAECKALKENQCEKRDVESCFHQVAVLYSTKLAFILSIDKKRSKFGHDYFTSSASA